ncbi:uroporphyrinogen-III C-methyltransferase [Nitrosomonas sp.]|uniref:uroporphyrinogen-III C-methyltransferase n=1 Tax=Nitrosomonas sp. TaxID=42353 RepID=UPI003305EC5D
MNKHTQTSTPGLARRLALFILIILILAVAVMLWNWAGKQGYIAAMEHSLTKYLADADVFSNRSRKMLDELEARKAEVEQRLNLLEENLQADPAFSPAVVELPADEGNGTRSDAWILGAVERLIVATDRQLRLTGDVRSALVLLKYAYELLQSSDTLGTSKLTVILTGEIERLETQPVVDVSEISRDIDTLAAQIEMLPLAMEAHLISIDLSEKYKDVPESEWWQRYLREIGEDLSRLVKIEKTDQGIPLLAPSQAHLLKENIGLQLILARFALLTRDEEGFGSAVKSASDWIQRYFDIEAQSVRDVLKELERLASIDIGSRLPDTEKLLKAVR